MGFRKRLTWIQTAIRVLAQADSPLTAVEIARRASAFDLKQCEGSEPESSVQAAIQRDLKANKKASVFVSIDSAGGQRTYWLRGKLC